MEAEATELIQKTLSQNRQFRKIAQKMASEVATQYGITYTQMLTLEILNNEPDMDLNQLAQRLHLSKSSVSGIVERLIQSQLVVKAKQAKDQRKLAIHLTATGRHLANILHEKFYECLAPILKLSYQDLHLFIHLHEKIIQSFEEAIHERQSS